MSIIEKALEKARRQALEATPPSPAAPAETPHPNATGETAATPHPAATTATGGATGGAPGGTRAPALTPPPMPAAGLHNILMGEEYRLLKERLLSECKESGGNLFMITSPMRNEGKTLVSCNLALSLAHEFDHTSLLVDADMRAPACHRMFGLPRGPGLSDCLLRDLPLREALVHTGLGKPAFLPAGHPAENPAELFSSNKMRALLREIKERYPDRVIIIDTAPILSFAETRALSRVVDGTLLVVRENVTGKSHLESALHCLENSRLLGLVYNDIGKYGPDREVFNLSYSY